MNEKITVSSTPKQAGNLGNMHHNIIISTGNSARSKGFINLDLSNHWRYHETYDFNISREAAADLMLALDVILSINK